MPKKKNSSNLEAVSEHVILAVDVALKNFLISDQSGENLPTVNA